MTELFARCDHEKERGRGRLANFTGDLYVYCVEPVCGPQAQQSEVRKDLNELPQNIRTVQKEPWCRS